MRTITRLAVSSNRENKTKSVLIMLTVMLTTMLLTAIAVFGYGSVRNCQVNAGRFYGAYYGSFANVSGERLAELSLRSEFAEIGVVSLVGSAEGQNQDNLALYCMDETARAMTNQADNLTEGHFPETGNELAGYRSFFQELGLKEPKLNDTLTVRYRKDMQSPYEDAQFVICGFLEEPGKASKKVEAAFVSSDYYEKIFAPEERSYMMYFTLDDSIAIDGGSGEFVIKELAKSFGISERYASDNYLYLNWALNPGSEVIVGCVGVGLVVVTFAVLVIYNIFQVGIVRKVQEYGKIKAIGTTRRQMKRIIFREGMMLAVPAIPIGLAAGFFVGKLFFESGVIRQSEFGVEGIPVSLFSIPTLLFVALVCFATVWLALKRPMRIVASISPVEAMRYQELPGRRRHKSVRRGRKTMDVKGLTLANLSAHRGRTISTILTLGLSYVLFMVIANLAGNMDAKFDARKEIVHGDYQIELTYSKDDAAYPENNLDAVLANNPLNEEFLEKMRQIEGVADIRTQDMLCFTDKGRMWSVVVLNEQEFVKEQKYGSLRGEFTYEQAARENAILYGWMYFLEDSGFAIGQQMDIELFNGSRAVSYSGELLGSFGGLRNADFAITDQTCEKLGFEEPSHAVAWITCDKGMADQVRTELEQLVSENEHLELESYAKQYAESKAGISLIRNIAYTFSIFVAVISFLNMANTLITSSITRKQEFGVLQAVGMTNAQLNWSLQAEGMLLTAGTVVVTLLIGIPAGYMLFRYGKSIGMVGLHVYHFPVVETLLMVFVLAVFQGILSLILSKNIKKESLVERIRYHE